MFAVTGFSTTIIDRLSDLTHEAPIAFERDALGDAFVRGVLLHPAHRYVLAAGILVGRPLLTKQESTDLLWVNLGRPIHLCEAILGLDPIAQICVIGSESAIYGSHDRTYAASKAGLHEYVLHRKVTQHQQLLCVAPTIIADSGMTQRRHDFPEVLRARKTVTARDVASVIHQMLWTHGWHRGAYLTNVIIPVAPNREGCSLSL